MSLLPDSSPRGGKIRVIIIESNIPDKQQGSQALASLCSGPYVKPLTVSDVLPPLLRSGGHPVDGNDLLSTADILASSRRNMYRTDGPGQASSLHSSQPGSTPTYQPGGYGYSLHAQVGIRSPGTESGRYGPSPSTSSRLKAGSVNNTQPIARSLFSELREAQGEQFRAPSAPLATRHECDLVEVSAGIVFPSAGYSRHEEKPWPAATTTAMTGESLQGQPLGYATAYIDQATLDMSRRINPDVPLSSPPAAALTSSLVSRMEALRAQLVKVSSTLSGVQERAAYLSATMGRRSQTLIQEDQIPIASPQRGTTLTTNYSPAATAVAASIPYAAYPQPSPRSAGRSTYCTSPGTTGIGAAPRKPNGGHRDVATPSTVPYGYDTGAAIGGDVAAPEDYAVSGVGTPRTFFVSVTPTVPHPGSLSTAVQPASSYLSQYLQQQQEEQEELHAVSHTPLPRQQQQQQLYKHPQPCTSAHGYDAPTRSTWSSPAAAAAAAVAAMYDGDVKVNYEPLSMSATATTQRRVHPPSINPATVADLSDHPFALGSPAGRTVHVILEEEENMESESGSSTGEGVNEEAYSNGGEEPVVILAPAPVPRGRRHAKGPLDPHEESVSIGNGGAAGSSDEATDEAPGQQDDSSGQAEDMADSRSATQSPGDTQGDSAASRPAEVRPMAPHATSNPTLHTFQTAGLRQPDSPVLGERQDQMQKPAPVGRADAAPVSLSWPRGRGAIKESPLGLITTSQVDFNAGSQGLGGSADVLRPAPSDSFRRHFGSRKGAGRRVSFDALSVGFSLDEAGNRPRSSGSMTVREARIPYAVQGSWSLEFTASADATADASSSSVPSSPQAADVGARGLRSWLLLSPTFPVQESSVFSGVLNEDSEVKLSVQDSEVAGVGPALAILTPIAVADRPAEEEESDDQSQPDADPANDGSGDHARRDVGMQVHVDIDITTQSHPPLVAVTPSAISVLDKSDEKVDREEGDDSSDSSTCSDSAGDNEGAPWDKQSAPNEDDNLHPGSVSDPTAAAPRADPSIACSGSQSTGGDSVEGSIGYTHTQPAHGDLLFAFDRSSLDKVKDGDTPRADDDRKMRKGEAAAAGADKGQGRWEAERDGRELGCIRRELPRRNLYPQFLNEALRANMGQELVPDGDGSDAASSVSVRQSNGGMYPGDVKGGDAQEGVGDEGSVGAAEGDVNEGSDEGTGSEYDNSAYDLSDTDNGDPWLSLRQSAFQQRRHRYQTDEVLLGASAADGETKAASDGVGNLQGGGRQTHEDDDAADSETEGPAPEGARDTGSPGSYYDGYSDEEGEEGAVRQTIRGGAAGAATVAALTAGAAAALAEDAALRDSADVPSGALGFSFPSTQLTEQAVRALSSLSSSLDATRSGGGGGSGSGGGGGSGSGGGGAGGSLRIIVGSGGNGGSARSSMSSVGASLEPDPTPIRLTRPRIVVPSSPRSSLGNLSSASPIPSPYTYGVIGVRTPSSGGPASFSLRKHLALTVSSCLFPDDGADTDTDSAMVDGVVVDGFGYGVGFAAFERPASKVTEQDGGEQERKQAAQGERGHLESEGGDGNGERAGVERLVQGLEPQESGISIVEDSSAEEVSTEDIIEGGSGEEDAEENAGVVQGQSAGAGAVPS